MAKYSVKKAQEMVGQSQEDFPANTPRKRMSKRTVARRGATKVVITPRKYEKPILSSDANKLDRPKMDSLEEINLNQELFIV
jgi:hypothetical protein